MNSIKRKKLLIVIGVLLGITLAIGLTYASWLLTKTQTNSNVVSAKCLDISISNEANDINLENEYPISDEEGMNLTPYTFTITNNCNSKIDYQIALESIGNETNALLPSSLKAVLNSNTPKTLNNYTSVDPTISGAYAAYKLTTGTLAAKNQTGDSATYNLRLWIDESAPVTENGKGYYGRVSVTVGQNIINAYTLAELILANNTLPSAEDDLGTSYYFTSTGSTINNYVKFDDQSISNTYYLLSWGQIQDTYNTPEACLTELQARKDEVLARMPQSAKSEGYESVDDYLNDFFGYSSFEEYFANEENYSCSYYCSEEAIAGSEECNGYNFTTVEEVATGKETERINSLWRIIRINGDGTVRIMRNGSIGSIGTEDTEYYGTNYLEYRNNNAKSTIDSWYNTNLRTNYGSYIADEIFCNNTQEYPNYDAGDYYGTNGYRNANNLSLTCPQADRYTVSNTKGNGLLTYPVGLITADEVLLYGSGTISNSTSNLALTMSPSFHASPDSDDLLCFYGYNYNDDINQINLNTCVWFEEVNIHPVINIKADVLFTGSGTIDDPYTLVK